MRVLQSVLNELRALWGGGRGTSLVAIAGGWGTLLGARMIYPVLLPYLRDAFDISLTVAGLLVTVLWLGSAVGQLPGGLLADRYSERSVMTAGALVVAAALVLVAAAPTALVLFAATALVGLGQSLYPIARITMLSQIYPDRIGSALGVTMATGDLGQTVLPPVAGVLAAAVAWQAGLLFVVPLLLVAGFVVRVTLPAGGGSDSGTDADAASADPLPSESVRDVLAEFRGSNLGFVSFILFLYILIWQSFTGLYPTYLVEQKGLSSAAAGTLFSAFFAFGVVVKPVAGAAYDRIGLRNTLVAVLVGPVAGLALLPVVEGFWPLAALTAVVSTMLGSGAVTQSFLSDAFSEEVRGTGLGVVRTTVATLGAAGPVLFGGLADRGYFDEGYVLLAAVLAVVVLLTLRLPTSSSPSPSG
ncbi:MFS transporter [Halogeometricum luteum]|uniref:MFS transporter n=1 Tax=Halogeometricum luteum TaxID=2950537 RepID=A0ABU2G5K7_9EURY|nr:MFS transporter [Halogeometricum sp. S3BR5-2]MDS0296077.1 MFS transporter [Halogeometricum sp. S3BR5-2]